jgi:predicted transcriptional regulator
LGCGKDLRKKDGQVNIRRRRPEKTGVNAPLGDLELAVMQQIWNSGLTGCLGSDVHQKLDAVHPIALTTALTTLDRLRDKGIIQREREGKAYRYWASVSEEQLQQRIVSGVLDRLIAQFPKAVATYFSQQGPQAVAYDESEILSDLARQIASIEHSPQSEDPDGH